MSKPIAVTPKQMAMAVSIITTLADIAMEGGKDVELRLGRSVVDEIVKLAAEMRAND